MRIPFPKYIFIIVLIMPLLAGCGREIEVFPEPGNVTESAEIIRQGQGGPVVVSYSSYPLRSEAPPDGIRAAVYQGIARVDCSAATFYWSERTMAERWIREQLAQRRRAGLPQRLILLGHGLGATEAAETAKDFMSRDPDVQIVMLITVDATKTGRISATAGATGTAIVNRMPGIRINLTAYDSAPQPDGIRLWSHINYYQDKGDLYHGTAMAGAENHLLEDWSGLLNHANADDFALPLIAADLRFALRREFP